MVSTDSSSMPYYMFYSAETTSVCTAFRWNDYDPTPRIKPRYTGHNIRPSRELCGYRQTVRSKPFIGHSFGLGDCKK